MTASVAELRAAFDDVLSRLPLFDAERKPLGEVIGMTMPLAMNGKAPKRLMVFPLGEPPSNDGRKWRFTEADLKRTVAEFKARTEPLPVYYEHGNGPRGKIAAGWIDSIDLAADGLYANFRWTDQAKKEIEAGEWGFRSPAWNGEDDPLGFIYAGPLGHIGLVNDPAIGGMSPNVASSQPSTPPTPPEKEKPMANVEAAKKTAALDQAGVLEAVRAKYPGAAEVFADDAALWAYLMGLGSGATDAPADPMMPGASTPAVPFASAKAEDVAVAAATVAATTEAELKVAKEQIASQEARLKALEGRELSGKMVNASAADRKPGPTAIPDAPSPGDFVGQSMNAYTQDRAPIHQAAIAYRDKARAAGQNVSYRDAVVAVTRRKTA